MEKLQEQFWDLFTVTTLLYMQTFLDWNAVIEVYKALNGQSPIKAEGF